MAKTLRTSGDYTIKTGTRAGGSNYVNVDSSNTRVMGNLIVDGTRTELNTSTLSVEDSSLLLNRNASGADIDSGLMIERDGSNNAAFYWNEGDDTWRAVLTASGPTATTIADTALAKIQVAEPSANSDVATKNYVDTTASGAILSGSTNNQVTTVTGANAIIGEANLTFDGSNLGVTGSITVNGVGHFNNYLRYLFDAHFCRVANINRLMNIRINESKYAIHKIGNVAKTSSLSASSKYSNLFVSKRLANKGGNSPAIVDAHPSSVGVKNPYDFGV